MLARAVGHEVDVTVGAVHTFQGGERDIVVVSRVATDKMAPKTIAWLASRQGRQLWNVAVSRARSRLVVVGDQAVWSQHATAPSGARGRHGRR